MSVAKPLLSDIHGALARVATAEQVLIALDFDGTIAAITSTPEQARPSREMEDTLAAIAGNPRYSLAIVSGRSLADLRQRLRIPATYVGNHGLEIEGDGVLFVHENAVHARNVIEQATWDVEAALVGIRSVQVERKGLSATVHYRNAPAALERWIRETVRFTLRPYRRRLVTVPAIQAVEIRPRVNWHKGHAVGLLRDRLGPATGLVCAGDDGGDEEMFGRLSSEVSIKVGNGRTRALYRARDISELLLFLKQLVAGAGPSGTRPVDHWTLSA